MVFLVSSIINIFYMYLFIWLQQVLVATCAIFLVAACGIQFPDQGQNLGPLHWEHKVLATGPLGKSPKIFLSCLQKNLHLHKHLYLDAIYLKYLLIRMKDPGHINLINQKYFILLFSEHAYDYGIKENLIQFLRVWTPKLYGLDSNPSCIY